MAEVESDGIRIECYDEENGFWEISDLTQYDLENLKTILEQWNSDRTPCADEVLAVLSTDLLESLSRIV